MKSIIAAFLILISAASFAQADTITTAQAKDYIGKQVVLKGKLIGFKTYTAKDGKDVMFLDIDGKYPNTLVGITIFNEALASIKLNQNIDLGKTVKISGVLEIYRDKPTIGIRVAESLRID